jgi:hypothetical protein
VPVLERDIYRPHEIEHTKRVVNIHHEAPEIIGTKVAKPISVSEWESQSGHSIRSATATTGSSSGLTGRKGRSGSSSSSSSDDEERYETVDGVRRKKGLGEKLKEKVGLDKKDGHGDPKDAAFNNNQTTCTGFGTGSCSSYGSSATGSSSQYGADGQRHKGIGEKAEKTVGLDPKDGRDPKDIGYGNNSNNNQSTSTSGTGTGYNTASGLNTNQSSSIGYNQGSSSSYGTTGTGTEYGVDGQRKKGLGEKAKEAVGLDPKDGRDPKDIGYNNNNNQSSTTGYNTGSSSTSTGLGSSSGVGSSGVNSTSTGSGFADSQRKKGFGEKVKEVVGLDPKDPARDPKDQGYVGGNAQPGKGVASEYANAR